MPNQTATLDDAFQLGVTNAFTLAFQRMKPLLRAAVTEKECAGEAVPASDIVGKVVASRIAGRQRSNPETRTNIKRRWLLYRDEIQVGTYIDKEDNLRLLRDPTSEYVQTYSAALARAIDEVIFGWEGQGGILGTVVEGGSPGGAGKALPAANTIADGNEGLTIAKIRKVRRDIAADDALEYGGVEICAAYHPHQLDNLLALAEAASAGASGLSPFEMPALREGKLEGRFMGMNWIEHTGTPLKAGTTDIRKVAVWRKDCIKLGVWEDMQAKVFRDTSARMTPYLDVFARMDCVRDRDEGVRVIECKEVA